MISHHKTYPRRILKAGGFPGGFARQFRVQFFDRCEPGWRMYATYGRREAADKCLDRLTQDGRQARVVDYSVCPTAL